MNVEMRVHILRTFITHLLIHIHQKTTESNLELSVSVGSDNNMNKLSLLVMQLPQKYKENGPFPN